jgi:hypothetical protein
MAWSKLSAVPWLFRSSAPHHSESEQVVAPPARRLGRPGVTRGHPDAPDLVARAGALRAIIQY